MSSAKHLAIARGERRYHGERCDQCGTCERYTCNGGCCECCRRRCAEYYASRHPKTERQKRRGLSMPPVTPGITLAMLMSGRWSSPLTT